MQEIWIVEDDVSINGLLLEELTKEGYLCRQVFLGTEAVLLLESGKLDNCGVFLCLIWYLPIYRERCLHCIW